MPDDRNSGSKPATSSNGWQLIAVQSISCGIIILIALIFRLVSGTAFDELRTGFNDSMMSNSFIATVTALFRSPQPQESGETATTSVTTPESIANASSVNESIPAVGGQDLTILPLSEKKMLYAPEGASFGAMSLDRIAVKPLENGKISSHFGYREDPIKGGDSFHQGLDIAAESGSRIAAMFYGVVKETGGGGSYGNYIIIDHGSGIEVLYAHCSAVFAEKGTAIRSGEIVASVGSTGSSTSSHLHIEIKKDGTAYDPAYVVPVSCY